MTIKEISERAQRIHREAIVIDQLEVWHGFKKIEDLRDYVKSLIKGGVTAVQVTVPEWQELPAAIAETANFYKLMEGVEDLARIALTAADIESAKKEGRVAVMMGMQDPMPYETNLDLIRLFYKLGFRVLQLSYWRQTYLSSGCAEQVDSGVTDAGREAIEEFNRLGILVDVSHCSDKTTIEAAEASKVPIAITHSGSRTLCPMPRATSDEAIKAVTERGGVIGSIFERPFIEPPGKEGPRPTLSDAIDRLDYLVNLAGVDHVGLAIDAMPGPYWSTENFRTFMEKIGNVMIYPHKFYYPLEEMYPIDEIGFRDMSGMIRVTEELLRHRYSDDETKKILGGNFLRLLKEVL